VRFADFHYQTAVLFVQHHGNNGSMAGPDMHTCIYCRRCLAHWAFSREHVLSRAFGTFKNAPVLHHAVCADCNQYFGDYLETRVARGAFEGMLRHQRGATRSADGQALRLRYVEFTLPEDSAWPGVRLQLVWRGERLLVEPLPQTGFLDTATRRWVFLTSDEIRRGALRNHSTLDTRSFRLYARPEEQPGMLALLEEHGVVLGKLEDLPTPPEFLTGGDISVEVTFTINKGIRRCMAKYAFNFLAFTRGADFLLAKDFDALRGFIRYGEDAGYPLVVEALEPILQDDTARKRQTAGHLLTVNWTASQRDLVGQVSLFNAVTYRVSLARSFRGIWRPVTAGLHFHLRTRTIESLTAIPSALLL
jgi:hypothetical protein